MRVHQIFQSYYSLTVRWMYCIYLLWQYRHLYFQTHYFKLISCTFSLAKNFFFSSTNPSEIMHRVPEYGSHTAVLCAKFQKHSSNKMFCIGESNLTMFKFKADSIGFYLFVWVSDAIQISCAIIQYRFLYPLTCWTPCFIWSWESLDRETWQLLVFKLTNHYPHQCNKW